MDPQGLLRHIRDDAKLESEAEAERLASVALEVVAERLAPVDAGAAARELPEKLAAALEQGARRDGEPALEDLFHRVADAGGDRLSVGLERTHVICQAVADALSDEGRRHLRIGLPPDWAELFEVVAEPPPPAGLGHDVFAQRGSLAREQNPHAQEKLSSGVVSQRGQPLSEGRPGSEEPLSEARGQRGRR